MSYILEALKKKDTDSDKSVPDLSSQHYVAELDDEPIFDKKWLLVIFIFLLLAAVAVLSYFLLTKTESGRDSGNSKSLTGETASEKSTSLEGSQNQESKGEAIDRGSESLVDIAIKEEPIQLQKSILEKITVKPQSKPKHKPETKAVAEISPEKEAANETALSEKGSREVLEESSLSNNFSQLPAIKYSAHVYADKPKDRFVMLNGKGLSIGEALPNGVRIEDILENDLLIKYKGELYKLPSLTDVNR